jgi:ABC-type amino acid transport substrate-binding protein
MKFRMFVVLLVVGIVTTFVLTRRNAQNHDLFIVGTAAGYAPFVSVNEAGQYEGFDIDVARALAQKLNKQLVIKDLGSMTALFMALQQGSIDAIIWGLSITQERLKKVAMVRYQGESTTAYPLIFWKEIPIGITTINDMVGKRICIEPTSSQDAVLRKYPFVLVVPTERVDDALLNLQTGKVDAAFVEPAIAKKFQAKFPEIKILNVPLSKEDQVLGVGVTIKKSCTELITQVEDAVKQLTDVIKVYEQKWGIE